MGTGIGGIGKSVVKRLKALHQVAAAVLHVVLHVRRRGDHEPHPTARLASSLDLPNGSFEGAVLLPIARSLRYIRLSSSSNRKQIQYSTVFILDSHRVYMHHRSILSTLSDRWPVHACSKRSRRTEWFFNVFHIRSVNLILACPAFCASVNRDRSKGSEGFLGLD